MTVVGDENELEKYRAGSSWIQQTFVRVPKPNVRHSQPPTLSAGPGSRTYPHHVCAIILYDCLISVSLYTYPASLVIPPSLRNMWHFLDLNHEEKLERRRLLDLYGSLAQISALIPLGILQLYFIATWLQKQWSRKHGAVAIPSSPQLKKQRSDALNGPLVKLQSFWQVALWWTSDTVDIFGSRANKGEVLSGFVWTAWLVFLSCVQTQGGMY